MSPSIPMSRIVDEVKWQLLEPHLPIDRIEQIIADEQAALDARRTARATEQEDDR